MNFYKFIYRTTLVGLVSYSLGSHSIAICAVTIRVNIKGSLSILVLSLSLEVAYSSSSTYYLVTAITQCIFEFDIQTTVTSYLLNSPCTKDTSP